MAHLAWRHVEDERPPGALYANVPRGIVVCPASGRASSRVWMWPVDRRGRPSPSGTGGWAVALGVVAGPHPESLYHAADKAAAMRLAATIADGKLLDELEVSALNATERVDRVDEDVREQEPPDDLEALLRASWERAR